MVENQIPFLENISLYQYLFYRAAQNKNYEGKRNPLSHLAFAKREPERKKGIRKRKWRRGGNAWNAWWRNCESWASLVRVHSFMRIFYISLSYLELLPILVQMFLHIYGRKWMYSDSQGFPNLTFWSHPACKYSNGLKEESRGLLKRRLNWRSTSRGKYFLWVL